MTAFRKGSAAGAEAGAGSDWFCSIQNLPASPKTSQAPASLHSTAQAYETRNCPRTKEIILPWVGVWLDDLLRSLWFCEPVISMHCTMHAYMAQLKLCKLPSWHFWTQLCNLIAVLGLIFSPSGQQSSRALQSEKKSLLSGQQLFKVAESATQACSFLQRSWLSLIQQKYWEIAWRGTSLLWDPCVKDGSEGLTIQQYSKGLNTTFLHLAP